MDRPSLPQVAIAPLRLWWSGDAADGLSSLWSPCPSHSAVPRGAGNSHKGPVQERVYALVLCATSNLTTNVKKSQKILRVALVHSPQGWAQARNQSITLKKKPSHPQRGGGARMADPRVGVSDWFSQKKVADWFWEVWK